MKHAEGHLYGPLFLIPALLVILGRSLWTGHLGFRDFGVSRAEEPQFFWTMIGVLVAAIAGLAVLFYVGLPKPG